MRDFLAEMLRALTTPYTQKDLERHERSQVLETNIGKLFSLFAWGFGTVEQQAELIRSWDYLDNAQGAVLDRYGANFGVQRLGANDLFYRLAIKVKLLSQLSGGDIETVLEATSALLGIPVSDLDLEERFPAKIGLDVNENDLSPDTLEYITDIILLVKRILAAGVGLEATLMKYREFRHEELVASALFNRSKIMYDLRDARRKCTENVGVATAVTARSKIMYDLPDARRTVSQTVPVAVGVVERTKIMYDLPDARRTVSEKVTFQAAAVERSSLTFSLPDARRTVQQAVTVCAAVFEFAQISVRNTY